MSEHHGLPRPVTPNEANRLGSGPAGSDAVTHHGARRQRTSLADLLDRVVDRGVVVSGDVIIQLAGVDLIRLDLRLLLIGIETAQQGQRAVRGKPS